MGFRKQKAIYRLVFEDPDLEGLEVRALRPSIGQLFELSDAEERLAANSHDREAALQLYAMFDEVLVSWNLEHQDHGPDCTRVDCECPWVETLPTAAGMQQHEVEFIRQMMIAWMNTTTEVPVGKEPPSSDGSPSLEESIPMEVA